MKKRFRIIIALGAFALFFACGDDEKEGDDVFKGVPLQSLRTGVDTVGAGTVVHTSCPSSRDCILNCSADACVTSCAERSEPQAFSYASDLILCIADNCPDEDLPCIQSICGGDDQRCADYDSASGNNSAGNPDPPINRPYNCSELTTCLSECESDACMTNCFQSASAAANQKFEAILTCSGECEEAGGTNCLENECSSEVQACIDDRYAP